jgi:starch synthase (maltosyl-transferring)
MGARLYNLFPTLAGPIAGWDAHFERIAAMRFDWVYVNPIHRTGSSQSLYAVADYYELNPLLRGEDPRPADDIVRDAIRAAHECGLSLMLDLVVNHTANDAPLVERHPDWYARDASGAVVAPSAVDPADPNKITVWRDLAELDYRERPARASLVDYFARVARHYVRLGIAGFRCDAAYKVPGSVWSEIIAAARAENARCVFAAETLGGSPQAVAQLYGAGFDYLFNSSKWWDFRAPWLMEQYEAYRHIAPSIAFPESHDTPRLAAELSGCSDAEIEAEYRFRYLFAASFSSGVMMPIGYEYGFGRALDVVRTRPEDWERPRFDLCDFIAAANATKAASRALSEEGGAQLVASEDGALTLVRRALSSADAVAVAIDPSRNQSAQFDPAGLQQLVGGPLRELGPGAATPGVLNGEPLRLGPLEIRLFERADETPAPSKGKAMHQVAGLLEFEVARSHAGPVVIENVTPQIDAGRHPVKRVVGDEVVVEADVFREGHDAIDATLYYRERGEARWRHVPMRYLENDRWTASFPVARATPYEYTIEGWPDPFATWQLQVEKKRAAGQALDLEALEGRALVLAARDRAAGTYREELDAALERIDALGDLESRIDVMLGSSIGALVARVPDLSAATRYEPVLGVDVDRRAAQFAAWYELFPRSAAAVPGKHGTFADVERRLPELRALGFDVVYFPPIHPIGHAFRKGRNNVLEAAPGDVGSPWAIGNEHGGHTAIEPALGDVQRLRAPARDGARELARGRARLRAAVLARPPLGSRAPRVVRVPARRHAQVCRESAQEVSGHRQLQLVRTAPPSALECLAGRRDLLDRTRRTHVPGRQPAHQTVRILGMDDRRRPRAYPETIFLAEAFTRPKVMQQLAKLGFAQSYTYFTWRTTKEELTEYLTELTQTANWPSSFGPISGPTRPTFSHPILQTGGRPAFRIRLFLAATLSSLYGIYSGYELCENEALPEREEYANSEKYEIRVRDWHAARQSIKATCARSIASGAKTPALHDWRNVTFYRADDDEVIFYGKRRAATTCCSSRSTSIRRARTTRCSGCRPASTASPTTKGTRSRNCSVGTKHVWRGSPHRWRLDPQLNPAAIFRLTLGTTSDR